MAKFYCPVCEEEKEIPLTKKCNRAFCSGLERYEKYESSNAGFRQYSISLAGGSAAGKTYYLINLIGRLTGKIVDENLSKFLEYKKLEFNFASKNSYNYFKQLKSNLERSDGYFATVIKPDEAEPFELELILNNNKRVLINLYNTSGEYYNQNNPEYDKWLNRGQFQDSNTFIYFIDPAEDSGLNPLLNPENRKNTENGPPKDLDILEVVQELLSKKERGALIQAPIAVVLSKFDLLEQWNGIHFQMPYIEIVDMHQDVENQTKRCEFKSNQIKEFIERHSTKSKPKMIYKKFYNTEYFGVSNIGSVENKVLSDMNPKGIYAPFFWLLKKSNIL